MKSKKLCKQNLDNLFFNFYSALFLHLKCLHCAVCAALLEQYVANREPDMLLFRYLEGAMPL